LQFRQVAKAKHVVEGPGVSIRVPDKELTLYFAAGAAIDPKPVRPL
jgi:hypothetical protein